MKNRFVLVGMFVLVLGFGGLGTMRTRATADEAAPTAAENGCASSPLDAATDFNLFVLGDLTQSGSDTGGRLAVGGRATLTNDSIGAAIPHGSSDVLVVGGDLAFNGGSVNGNALVGGHTALTGVTFAGGGGARHGTAFDFGAARASLTNAAASYAALPANGTTTFQYGVLTLTGTDATRDVFTVAGADLNTANSLTIRVPSGATVLVNVAGAAIRMANMGIGLGGADRGQVLYNFSDATSLILSGIGVDGSILAPRADLSFPDGVITGTLAVASLNGPGQANPAPFTGCLPPAGGSSQACQPLEATLSVTTGATQNAVVLTSGPSARRNSLPIGSTVSYRVVDPSTGMALSDTRSTTVMRSPAGFGTINVALAPFGATTAPDGTYLVQVSASPNFPMMTDPSYPPNNCTLQATFRLS